MLLILELDELVSLNIGNNLIKIEPFFNIIYHLNYNYFDNMGGKIQFIN
jgi:hypothetical protein